jgi:trans-aconitate 2-methyltransferase
MSPNTTEWDPVQYDRFADERGRPFFDLVGRIRVASPQTVVDLGCGSGNLTATLVDRWPTAQVIGIDNDTKMLLAAATKQYANVQFTNGDIATWKSDEPVDVIVANAALQWVPQHLAVLPQLVAQLHAGGALAIQVPGNFEDPHHLAIRQMMARPRWRAVLGSLPERAMSSYPAMVYQSALSHLGCDVDTWETTYVHVLHGPNPVLEWVKGTALRPVLSTLSSDDAKDFCAELSELLNSAYGSHPWGTPFPFKRIFAVAHKRAR